MKNKILLSIALLVSTASYGLESVFLGAEFGQITLNGGGSSYYQNALGYGVDLGFRTNPMLDLTLRSQMSTHSGSGGLTLWSNTLSADFLVGNLYDIELFLGGGPGVYQFTATPSGLLFGLHGEAYGDLLVGDALKIGLGFRYHGLFNPAINQGSYWTIMMRAGFTFGSGR